MREELEMRLHCSHSPAFPDLIYAKLKRAPFRYRFSLKTMILFFLFVLFVPADVLSNVFCLKEEWEE